MSVTLVALQTDMSSVFMLEHSFYTWTCPVLISLLSLRGLARHWGLVVLLNKFLHSFSACDMCHECCCNTTYAFPCRRVMSSAFCRQQGPDGREHSFKTSGMLLKLAYVPEYAAKLLVILDDDEQVWTDASDQALQHIIARQQSAASDCKPADKRALVMFSNIAKQLHGKAYLNVASGAQLRPLANVLRDVAFSEWKRYYPFCTRRRS